MCGPASLTAPVILAPRRRSVDVGGLALSLKDETHGQGWGGWDDVDLGGTQYAENLIDVRAHTEMAVNLEGVPTSMPVLDNEHYGRLIKSLSSWTFEPHKLLPDEVLTCAYILFEAIFRIDGMSEDCGAELKQMPLFLNALQQTYRQVNNYHNFEHALDVFQAIYCILRWEGLVPELSILLGNETWTRRTRDKRGLIDCLNNSDIFTLCVAAVGHDVGHPGLTNAFMKNAKTPLAVVYDDKSVLEQMHYSLLLQVMRQTGLGAVLERPSLPSTRNTTDPSHHSDPPMPTINGRGLPKTVNLGCGNTLKKLLLLTVLSTDMGVHDEFMNNFNNLISRTQDQPVDNPDDFATRVLVCQALIKCTDISNPARPYTVSQHWASALSNEWSTQLLLEKHLQLPTTVYPSLNELGKARGQVFFIERFASPLFNSVKRGIPEMNIFARQCKENLRIWKELGDKLSNEPPFQGPLPTVSVDPLAPDPLSPSFPTEFLSAFPPTLPKSLLEPDHSDDRFDGSSNGLSRRTSSSSLDSATDFVSASGDSLPADDWELEQGSQYESCESDSPRSTPSSPAFGAFPPKLNIPHNRPPHLRHRSHSSRHSNHSHRHSRTPSGVVSPHTTSHNGPQSEVPPSPDAQSQYTRPPSIFSAQSNRTSFTNTSNTTSASVLANHATVAIRKAYKASVRKTKSLKNFHRSSWNPSPAEFNALLGRSPVVFNFSTASMSTRPPTDTSTPNTNGSNSQSNKDNLSPLTPELGTSAGTTPNWSPLTPGDANPAISSSIPHVPSALRTTCDGEGHQR